MSYVAKSQSLPKMSLPHSGIWKWEWERGGEGWGERKTDRLYERSNSGMKWHEELRPGARRLLGPPFASCVTMIESLYLSGPQFLC